MYVIVYLFHILDVWQLNLIARIQNELLRVLPPVI